MSNEAAGQIDPLDTAYLAIGAIQAWAWLPDVTRHFDGGQREFVSSVIEHSQLLAQKWGAWSEEFPGVWAYEVAEVFGERAGALLLAGDAFNACELADQVIAAAMN